MDQGTYALILHVPYDLALNVGQLGTVNFKTGYYVYVGSALGGLDARVSRHLRKEKKLHWHIDHLLLHARAVDIVVVRGKDKKECEVAAEIAKRLSAIPGFGSSDCKCESHLFYHADFNELRSVVFAGLKELGLKPEKIEGFY